MKKGDIIRKKVVIEAGQPVGYGFTTNEKAKAFQKTLNFSSKIVADSLNESGLMVVALGRQETFEEAKVNWVVGDEAGITFKASGLAKVINLNEEADWKVFISAVPSYQSSVAKMSVEQLRDSIEALRGARANVKTTPFKRAKKADAVDKNDPVALALSKMSPDKKAALMKKLGMV